MRGGTYRRGRTVIRTGRGNENDLCGRIILALLTGIFLVAIPVLNISNENALLSTKIISQKVADHAIDVRHANKVNDIVHIEGATYDSTVHDAPFNLNLPHGVNLKRKTEYCQWKEISSSKTRCHGEGENKECIEERTYHYVKSWSPFLVNSFLFDQPAAHHNPSRDPFPTTTIPSKDLLASVNHQPPMCMIEPSVLQHAKVNYRPIDFTIGAKPPPPSFFTRLWYRWFGSSEEDTHHTRYEDISALQGTQYSKAATGHGFYYVGQGGYFFSPYQESTAGKLAKAFFGYLEGSLFDWQFGDLMPSCTPGDIRVQYYVQDPDQISVLGILQADKDVTKEELKVGSHFDMSQLEQRGDASTTSTSLDADLRIGYVHEGAVSSKYMMDAVVYESWLYVIFTRALLIPWSYVTARLLGAFVGYELRNGCGTPYPTSMKTIALAVFGIWAFAVAFCELMVNRNSASFQEFDHKTQHSSGVNTRILILLLTCVVSCIVVDRNAARTNSFGFDQVLNLFGRKESK